MACQVKTTWFGLQVYWDEPTTETVIGVLNAEGNIGAAVAAGCAAVPGGAPVAFLAAIAAAVGFLGNLALIECDSRKRGVIITVLWIGTPWCTGQ